MYSQRTCLAQLPSLMRAIARTSTSIDLDTDPQLLAALRQLLGAFIELPPAMAVESTVELALRQELVTALSPWTQSQEGRRSTMPFELSHSKLLTGSYVSYINMEQVQYLIIAVHTGLECLNVCLGFISYLSYRIRA